MADKKKEMIDTIFEALKKEIKREPLSPDRVSALTELIKALGTVN